MQHDPQPAEDQPAGGIDYERLCSSTARLLRGKRSQESFNRRPGYDSNVSYLWESGRRAPNALAFFQGLVALGRPWGRLGAFGLSEASAFAARGQSVGPLLSELAQGHCCVALSRNLPANRTTVGRGLSGATVPRLPTCMSLLNLRPID